ncbi:RNA polymerase II transcription factor SIII subunit A-domain-containing protein [Ephemerocybe angulata]|uniref:RNA polymerase II transcription factor SIII subunit A-domain-containing protein n=1 Tax=Ephemerocybe angulata TaxID=980116 RepID=A0A8H6IEF8_9AGAR|nr:RNA polymerase II transcription factor SIII subunit A-domain-containing protein [Tulosesus angulatus]
MASRYDARVPSLIFLCQRVAANNAEAITSLGSELSFHLVKPILERCGPDQLVRLEEASPHLMTDTPDIWREMCFQKYRLIAEEHYSPSDEPEDPDSWKNRYFFLQEAEIKRFEEVGSRIRSQRMEADERKKEREVRFTDRVPPPKRSRTGGWGGAPAQPKTLFQKTRTEASKIQKAFYNSRSVPPRQVGKTVRVHATPDHSILPPIPSSIPSRVTVNTITLPRHPPPSGSSASSSSPASTTSRASPPSCQSSSFDMGSKGQSTRDYMTPLSNASSPPPSRSSTAPPLKSPGPIKKDPMASLFVPKHRAYSQRPHS